ncbi:hypothetical protein OG225_17150 [Nocardia sp. NBC_01377]
MPAFGMLVDDESATGAGTFEVTESGGIGAENGTCGLDEFTRFQAITVSA